MRFPRSDFGRARSRGVQWRLNDSDGFGTSRSGSDRSLTHRRGEAPSAQLARGGVGVTGQVLVALALYLEN